MSDPAESSGALSNCGCCEIGQPPSASVTNPPGLPALAYRLGTHPTFLHRMLGRLFLQAIPDGEHAGQRPLAALSTRSGDDLAIALLDAWATTADVLTFYQERIANEGFLRTATERRSILELARAIGYELGPGVAANVALAYTVEEATGSPETAVVPAGTKVQSVPGPNELPQTFETSAEIVAKKKWNALRPRKNRPQELAIKGGEVYLLGRSTVLPEGTSELITISTAEFGSVYLLDATTPLDVGEGDLKAVPVDQLYLEGTASNLKAGDLLLFVGLNSLSQKATAVKTVQRVVAESELKRTRLDLKDQPKQLFFSPPSLAKATVSLVATPFNQTQVKSAVLGKSWSEGNLNAFTAIQGWSASQLVLNVSSQLTAKPAAATEGLFAFRQRVGFFGHNAPRWQSVPKLDAASQRGSDPYLNSWEGRSIWVDSQGTDYGDPNVYLDRSLPEVVRDSWAVFVAPGNVTRAYQVSGVVEESRSDYSLSAKVTGLSLTDPDDTAADEPAGFEVRKTTAYVQSEKQVLAQLPIADPLLAGDKSLMLDGLILGLQIGQPIILTGERSDAPGVIENESLVLSDIIHTGGYTTLHFEAGLQYGYLRDTVTVNANVAWATHGETVPAEVLGSGNGARPNQSFTLKKPPLTYVSAATPSGGQSTLRVRVNGVEWARVASLYGLGPNDQAFVVRHDDDGNARLTFGDGLQGARLPTGRENVVATYRSGVGLVGEVPAGSLTTLQSRPLGIRGALNPLPASGAEDPEKMADARENAPLTVLTMERIVSLRDFEAFGRSFAGIGKARAVELWNGESKLAHITVATAGGDPVVPPLLDNLAAAIDLARDPAAPGQVRVDTFQPLFFNVKAKILVDSRYMAEAVLAQVQAALLEAFAFEQRAFGQPVTAAEVMTVMQQVAGVTAVDLDRLYLVSDPSGPAQVTPPAVLPSNLAYWPLGGTLQLAQLLLINPVGVELDEMTAPAESGRAR